MDIQEIKSKIEVFFKDLSEIKETLKIDTKKEELASLEKITLNPGFWNDEAKSSQVLKDIKDLKIVITSFNKVYDVFENVKITFELLKEEQDDDLVKEITKNIHILEKQIDKLKVSSLLSGEYDSLNAIITIHAGAGGTESQDWVEMLNRMYTRWCEKSGFEYILFDMQEGDEAGIKSITFMVKGLYAYGYLKSEKGVHRLVRISPFDANKRRHTSFAAVDVMPEIDDKVQIEIKPEDIEMDTYRASGAGGQHINKTDSAVRIRHLPTGIVVSCQTERSQIQNRETCMKMLKAKLYQYELNKTEEKLKEIKGELSENGWGSQIRSYVFCPYTMVKDHRTNFEIGNVNGVMDGDLDPFITSFLKMNANN